MGMPVRDLLGRISGRELAEWIAFDQVEPIGGLRGDYQAAVVAATVTNGLRGGKGKRFVLDDFLPFGDARRAVQEEAAPGAEVEDEVEAVVGQSTESQVRAMRQMLWGDVDAGRSTAASSGDMEQDDDPQRLRGGGGDVGFDRDGVGGVDAADDGHT